MNLVSRQPWYSGGLAFACIRCGRCCAGPEEGYVWIAAGEIEALAEFLSLPVDETRRRYIRQVGRRTTIVEEPGRKDCTFLAYDEHGHSACRIYEVRPAQCRTWPFWPRNIADADNWNLAGARCPGVNRGSLHGLDEIQRKRDQTNP